MVKWISQRSSEPFLGVRIPPGAQILSFKAFMQSQKNFIEKVPHQVASVLSVLEGAGFEAYMVGGSVRDLLMGRIPKDWDVTTNATPEQIVSLFEKTIYENNFGTVGVCLPIDSVSRETLDKVTHETSGSVSYGTSSHIKDQSVLHETHEGFVNHETPEYMIIEVTPYRIEAKYSDFRHPDEVLFSQNLSDDLKRRDFTVNAMAMDSKDK